MVMAWRGMERQGWSGGAGWGYLRRAASHTGSLLHHMRSRRRLASAEACKHDRQAGTCWLLCSTHEALPVNASACQLALRCTRHHATMPHSRPLTTHHRHSLPGAHSPAPPPPPHARRSCLQQGRGPTPPSRTRWECPTAGAVTPLPPFGLCSGPRHRGQPSVPPCHPGRTLAACRRNHAWPSA